MADTPSRLYGPARPTNAAADQVAAEAGVIKTIGKITIFNPSAADVNYTMSIGADAAGVRVIDAMKIPAGELVILEPGWVLAANEKTQHFASTTGVLNVCVNGIRTV